MELFNDHGADTEINLKINKSYASKYSTWRQGEELSKLKNLHGSDVLDKSSDSSEDDDDAIELTEQVEKDFFKTLSCLKQKDPSIYDQNVKFFTNESSEGNTDPAKTKKKKKHNKPLFLRDYERNLILERDGILSDDDEEYKANATKKGLLSIAEEEKTIKASFKGALNVSDEEDNALGGLFQQREKTEVELEKENEGYMEWLKGQRDDVKDKNIKTDLKYLHDYWNNPELDKGEQFLKDYLLNRKFLLKVEEEDHIPKYDEVVHDSDQDLSEDERMIEKQTQFEHKYNFRYEEPDQEFIKRFPRTMENSLRKKDGRRKLKREDRKQRKLAEKTRMREEVKQMKALKRKEILERIEKLKGITGNNEVGFNDKDLKGDFDPNEHDKRMGQLFNDEFYGENDDEKPEFPEMDRELELEKWDDWNGQSGGYIEQKDDGNEPHCEDPDFNMDCEYDPRAEFQAEVLNSTRKKKRNRRNRFEEVLKREKPVFDPKDSTFDEYVNEYYNLDFEDVIGDLPCRFKYRKVVANNFGLTIEEILKADDKELNRWCSLKRAVQHRSDYVEAYDIKAYQRKGRDENLKRKILPSLYKVTEETSNQEEQQPEETKKKKKSKKRKNHESAVTEDKIDCALKINKKRGKNSLNNLSCGPPAKIPKTAFKNNSEKLNPPSMFNVMTEDMNKEKLLQKSEKKKKLLQKSEKKEKLLQKSEKKEKLLQKSEKKGKGKKSEHSASSRFTGVVQQTSSNGTDKKYNKNKRNQLHKDNSYEDKNEATAISDTRLRAYGIRPKKYKNKLKYKNDVKPAYLKYTNNK